MSEEEKELKNRLTELAERAYSRNKYVFTTFLSAGELEVFYRELPSLSFATPKVFGGYDDAERALVRFGSTQVYEQAFPIVCLKITPQGEKFAEELSHRDYLGAIMNLGIERNAIGDLVQSGKDCYLYCLESMASFIAENLNRVRHTSVKCTPSTGVEGCEKEPISEKHFLSSLRADCAVAAVFRLSREDASAYFDVDKVFINGRICKKSCKELAIGDVVTVRGKGRFTFAEIVAESRKGRLCCIFQK